jgi:hypothetical protein
MMVLVEAGLLDAIVDDEGCEVRDLILMRIGRNEGERKHPPRNQK